MNDLVVKVLAISINSRFQAVEFTSVVRTGVKRRARRGVKILGVCWFGVSGMFRLLCMCVFFLMKER